MRARLLFLLICCLPLSARAAEVQEIKTPSGLTAWMIEEHSSPIIAVRLVFKNAGSAQDPRGLEGRAELTTELLLEGAGTRDALAFNQALEDHAIKISTQSDQDFFAITLQTLTEHRQLAFSLLGDMLARPRFAPDAIARIRASALTNLTQMAQSPAWHLNRTLNEALYGSHPYARPEEGTRASLTKLRKEDFHRFAQRYLTRENLVLSAAGDITPDEFSALIEKNLAALPAHYDPESPIAEANLPEKGSEKHVEFDVPQTLVAFAMPGIKREDPDYLVAYVANYLIGGGSLTSRLGKEVREKRGLTYGIDTSLDPQAYSATFGGNFSTRSAQSLDAMEVTRRTLQDIREKGFTDEELSDAKRYLTGAFVMGLDTNRELAGMLSTMQLYGLGKDYIDKRNGLINAVDKPTVEKMASRLLDLDRMVVVMVGKQAKEQPKGEGNAK